MGSEGQRPKLTRTDTALTIVGLVAVVAIFVPFTGLTSPMNSVWPPSIVWFLGLPFFFAVPISLASAAWLAGRMLPAFARVLLYVMSCSMLALTLAYTLSDLFEMIRLQLAPPREPRGWLEPGPPTIGDWLVVAALLLVIGLGICITVWHFRKFRDRSFNPVMAMQWSYIANALLSLTVAWQGVLVEPGIANWRIGAYLTVVACAAYAAQIVRAFRSPLSGRAPLEEP
jgi:hypothetical protein